MADAHDIEGEIATLRAEVRRLADVVAITQLIAQYGPNVDSGAASETAALWTEEGVFSVLGGESTFAMRGRGDIRAMVNGGHQTLIQAGAAHVLTTPHVAVQGDTATARSHALNIRWDPAADRFWVARVSANLWKLVRSDEGWRIAERTNAILDGAEVSREILSPARIEGIQI